MMNFLNNINLIPKNFMVANIVDTLKDDPETGVEKVFEMADKFVKDPDAIDLLEQVKDTYFTRTAIRMYTKNLIYNTNKNCLNHGIQNIVVKQLIEGLSKREQLSHKYCIKIPHSFVLDMGVDKINEVERLVGQAREMGIHLILFTKDDERFLKIYEKYSDVQFLVLTESSSLTIKCCQDLVQVSNVIPMIMLGVTKGEGRPNLNHLKTSGLLYGVITLTHLSNWQQVTTDEFILPLIRQGSRLHGYVTSSIAGFNQQTQRQLRQRLDHIRQIRPYMVVHLEIDQLLGENLFEGKIKIEETINQKEYQITFPAVNSQNSQGKNLIQIFKETGSI